MDSPQEVLLASFLQATNGLEILDADAFHVLSTTGVDIPVFILVSLVRVVRPMLLKYKERGKRKLL